MMHTLLGLNEETEGGRLAIEALIPPDAVMVTGPQGSGTRLMCRIIEAGGFAAWHDSRHGLARRPVDRVVVMRRERTATLRSIEQNFLPPDHIDIDISLANCAEFYPDAAWVDYDMLCAMPDAIISGLARWLGVGSWLMPEPIVVSPNTRRTA